MGAMLRQDMCTQNDYVRLFADSAEPLRWLCYTLTGNEELSGKVLKAALAQSLQGRRLRLSRLDGELGTAAHYSSLHRVSASHGLPPGGLCLSALQGRWQ